MTTVDAIEAALAKVGVLPIDPDWTYTVIRNGQRNMDVNVADGFNEPNCQGGTFMAEIVNAAPDLIATIRTLNAALAAMTAERDALREALDEAVRLCADERDDHEAAFKQTDEDDHVVRDRIAARQRVAYRLMTNIAALNPTPS